MIRNLRELHRYRGLLYSLVIRELQARYRASVLGFVWTFLNPTLTMAVYAFVFGRMMENPNPHYPYTIFCSLLPWIYFSSSVNGGATAVSDRRDLLTKVRFPAQVLPATVVAANLINYILSLPLLLILGLFYSITPTWHALLFIVVVFVQTVFTLALSYALSALNVAFRDLQHIVASLTQLLMFSTPVLWNANKMPEWYYYANPVAGLIRSYQEIFSDQKLPQFEPLAAVAALSIVLLWISARLFEHRREEFAELV